ncbi:transcriptional regulator, TetR family [Oceanobacillus limi]|uniref:Transcriptional regulator, TetR family n=1 Tax=Oceanobacillus limi TaxID=930131 RepID=A0A1I0EL50_9BACI|nr:forespore capture DNA-binding protein RefZ [Oceanobacillus limi]SET45428.1 transcriptional regulator, TetR family [Oceanobacillus limi]
MKNSPTKQKVIHAASKLFFQKGFHGTSVRDIAEAASVNVSLISYYFKGKQGLLEYAVTQYYEAYLETMEESIRQTETVSSEEKIKKLIWSIIQYKQNNLQFSCFIHRELSLDSVFVREMAVTYLAKENYLLSMTFMDAVNGSKQSKVEREFLLLQLKGMLVTPYILHNEWKKQVVGDYSHAKFIENYVQSIHNWLDYILHPDEATNNPIV